VAVCPAPPTPRRLEHFTTGASGQTITTAAATSHPHLVSYGTDRMLLAWQSGRSMLAQVYDAGTAQTVGDQFTIAVRDPARPVHVVLRIGKPVGRLYRNEVLQLVGAPAEGGRADHGTLMLHRRLVREHESRPESSVSRTLWGSAANLVRRLTGTSTPSWR